jgi:hypothetical protein
MKHSIALLENQVNEQNVSHLNQIVFIISDGRFNKEVYNS